VTWSASERCKHRPARGNACVLGISIMGLIDPCLKRSSVLSGGKCPRLEARWEDQQTGGLPLWLPRRSPEDDPDQTAGQTRAKRGSRASHPIGPLTTKSGMAHSVNSQPCSPCICRRSAPSDPNAPHAPFSQLRLIVPSSQTPNSTPHPSRSRSHSALLLKSPTSPEDQGQRNMKTLSHFKSATARKRNAADVAV
jgi:hypothetical protein